MFPRWLVSFRIPTVERLAFSAATDNALGSKASAVVENKLIMIVARKRGRGLLLNLLIMISREWFGLRLDFDGWKNCSILVFYRMGSVVFAWIINECIRRALY